MSRVSKRFAGLKAKGEGGLVCFVTVGDPDIDTTRRIVLELDRAGADVVELGIPFSDPIADGPSIQAASMRALERGVNVSSVLELVRAIRKDSDVPITLMTYYNPIRQYGLERFARDASDAGADAVIVTDLTPEESGAWKSAAEAHKMDTIFLLAPTSTDSRIEKVVELASGFVYCVSRTGVTGAQSSLAEGIEGLVERIRARSPLPVAVGFGISSPEHVAEVCSYADAAVVGSALVNLIADKAGTDDLLGEVNRFVSALKGGARGKRSSYSYS